MEITVKIEKRNDNLKERRQAAGLSQSQLAKLARCRRPRLPKLRAGSPGRKQGAAFHVAKDLQGSEL